jgi:DNA mismatch endonuclease (patch repair protein)
MADNVSKKRRSEIMSAVRSTDSKPELIVRRYLFNEGFRYRLHDKSLPGKPDIKLTKYHCVVLVHGCFWHGHENCNIYVMPKTNSTFWKEKIERNLKRDAKNIKLLKSKGWRVIIVWECELRKKRREKSLKELKKEMLN